MSEPRIRIQFQKGHIDVVKSEIVAPLVTAEEALKGLQKLFQKALKVRPDREWAGKLSSVIGKAAETIKRTCQAGGFSVRERHGGPTWQSFKFQYGPGRENEYRIDIECHGDKDVDFFGRKQGAPAAKIVVTAEEAVRKINVKVEPDECFIWGNDKEGYEPIPGTGCAHWVAHQKKWNQGKPGDNACVKGFYIRVPDIKAKSGGKVALDRVEAGNIWIHFEGTHHHCGVVTKVQPAKGPGQNPAVTIRHCDDKRGVILSDWTGYFRGKGDFYKG